MVVEIASLEKVCVVLNASKCKFNVSSFIYFHELLKKYSTGVDSTQFR